MQNENQEYNGKINPGELCAFMTKYANMLNHVNDMYDKATVDMKTVFLDPNISMEEKQKVYDCYNTLYMTWRDSCRLGPPPMDFPPLEKFMEAIVERVGGGSKGRKTRKSRKTRKGGKATKARK